MKKYQEVCSYIIFGILTTVVNISIFYVLSKSGFDFKISTTIAWVISVLFAFITNKNTFLKVQKINPSQL